MGWGGVGCGNEANRGSCIISLPQIVGYRNVSGSRVNLQFSTSFVAIELKISSIINFTKTKLLKQISSV